MRFPYSNQHNYTLLLPHNTLHLNLKYTNIYGHTLPNGTITYTHIHNHFNLNLKLENTSLTSSLPTHFLHTLTICHKPSFTHPSHTLLILNIWILKSQLTHIHHTAHTHTYNLSNLNLKFKLHSHTLHSFLSKFFQLITHTHSYTFTNIILLLCPPLLHTSHHTTHLITTSFWIWNLNFKCERQSLNHHVITTLGEHSKVITQHQMSSCSSLSIFKTGLNP